MPELDVSTVNGITTVFAKSSDIGAALEACRAGRCDILAINGGRGFDLDNIDFLSDNTWLERVTIAPGLRSWSLEPLRSLTGLRELVISADTQGLSLSDFPRLQRFYGFWSKGLLPPAHDSIEVLDLSKYSPRSRDLTSFPVFSQLQELHLVQGNLMSLEGIARLPRLRKVVLSYMRGLAELHDAEGLDSLVWFECDSCRSLRNPADRISQMTSLEVLRLNNCNPLPSIGFIRDLRRLEEFRFVGTDVVDGDLSPLLRLKSVGFLKKKGLSHTPEEVKLTIGDKSP